MENIRTPLKYLRLNDIVLTEKNILSADNTTLSINNNIIKVIDIPSNLLTGFVKENELKELAKKDLSDIVGENLIIVNGKLSAGGSDYDIATEEKPGLVKIGYTENGKNYPIKLSNDQMYVNVPWEDTQVLVDDVTIGKRDDSKLYVKNIGSLSGDFNGVFATEQYVDEAINSSKATFRGTFQNINDLPKTGISKNDYAFVISSDQSGNPEYARYKYTETNWLFEYIINNSSFTSEQWESINSKITKDKVQKLILNDNISVSYWNETYEKQKDISFGDLAEMDLSSIAGLHIKKYEDGGVGKLCAEWPTTDDLRANLSGIFQAKGDYLSSSTFIPADISDLTDNSGKLKTTAQISSELQLTEYMKKTELSDFLIVTNTLPENPDINKFYFITKS